MKDILCDFSIYVTISLFITSKGFVDLGCGNGLLVYLLTKEGIPNGVGLDIRKRKIWNFFREQGTDLRYGIIIYRYFDFGRFVDEQFRDI